MNKPQFKIACRLPNDESNGLTFEPNDEGRIDAVAYRTGYLGSIDPKALTALSEWAKIFIGKEPGAKEIEGLSDNPARAYAQGRRDGRLEALHAVEVANERAKTFIGKG